MSRIDLSNIAWVPGARGRYQISEALVPTKEYTGVGPVTGELTVENTGSLLLLRGHLRGLVRLQCVRCLGYREHALEMEVQEEFAAPGAAADVETVDREEPERSAISDYVLDVAELVRQQVAVHLPMAFVCAPDCLGICPRCGGNLNEGPCGCPPEAPDDRWGQLRALLPEPAEDA